MVDRKVADRKPKTAVRHPLEEVLGHGFAAPEILEQALTHRGALGVHRTVGATEGNERLEFLGDRVLGLVIAETLLKTFPDESEGELAPRLAALVSATSLARIARACGLAKHIKLARGQKADDALLADACEAVIGALYLDGGMETAARFIGAQWDKMIHEDVVPPKDAKTALQEWAQGRGLPLPEYKVIESSGPAHAPSFVMTVSVKGHPETRGQGKTKRLATQAAAAALLAKVTAAP